jgi:hypothetical protein
MTNICHKPLAECSTDCACCKEEEKHRLIFRSDTESVCSCGKWSYTAFERTPNREYIKRKHKFHINQWKEAVP